MEPHQYFHIKIVGFNRNKKRIEADKFSLNLTFFKNFLIKFHGFNFLYNFAGTI